MVAQVSRPDNGWLSDGACADKRAPHSWKLAGWLIQTNGVPRCSGTWWWWFESGEKGVKMKMIMVRSLEKKSPLYLSVVLFERVLNPGATELQSVF